MDYDVRQQAAEIVAGIWQEDTLEQRLRTFLVSRFGPAWQFCELRAVLNASDCTTAWLAAMPDLSGEISIGIFDNVPVAVHMISLTQFGTFALCLPSPVENETPVTCEPVERTCFDNMKHALAQTRVLIHQCGLVEGEHKQWIYDQLLHVLKHLKKAMVEGE